MCARVRKQTAIHGDMSSWADGNRPPQEHYPHCTPSTATTATTVVTASSPSPSSAVPAASSTSVVVEWFREIVRAMRLTNIIYIRSVHLPMYWRTFGHTHKHLSADETGWSTMCRERARSIEVPELCAVIEPTKPASGVLLARIRSEYVYGDCLVLYLFFRLCRRSRVCAKRAGRLTCVFVSV